MEFIDRQGELRRLRTLLERPEGAFGVVWGRRRVGKTRLLLEWIRSTSGLYWVAEESAPAVQRRYFAQALEERLPGFGQVVYPDWGALFDRLAQDALRLGWRGPLIIDELPFLLGTSPEVASVLQRFIDHGGKKVRLVLVVAGSSQRMMQGLALDRGAPLYGRAHELMKLAPLRAGYVTTAFGDRNGVRCIESYAAWGGIPRYWELAVSIADVREAIEKLVLDPLGPLHEEPARLLLEERPPAVALRPILDVIGAGVHRVSEIAGRIEQPATSLARPLARLQELDLVFRETPYGASPRSTKRALYKLADPFLRLWFFMVGPRKGLLAQAPHRVRRELIDRFFSTLCAQAWEELCREAVPVLGKRLGADFGPAGRLWSREGPEWDMVAEAVESRTLLVGEAWWAARMPSAREVRRAAESLCQRVLPIARDRVERVLFVPTRPKGLTRMEGVHLLDARDVLDVLT